MLTLYESLKYLIAESPDVLLTLALALAVINETQTFQIIAQFLFSQTIFYGYFAFDQQRALICSKNAVMLRKSSPLSCNFT